MALEHIGELRLSLLDSTHDTMNFDCVREPALNEWLKERALKNQEANHSRVWALLCQNEVVRGYFTLSGHVLHTDVLSSRERGSLKKGTGCSSQLLGRFAIDKSVKGNKVGALLMDLVFEKYAEIIGLSTSNFLCLDAKNEFLVGYYQQFGFKVATTGPSEDGSTLMYLRTSAILSRFQLGHSATTHGLTV